MSLTGRVAMKSQAGALAIFLLAGANCVPALGQTCPCVPKRHHAAAKHVNADLEMAKMYARHENWPEAETHFVLAARDPLVQKEAMAGLEDARTYINAENRLADEAVLRAGKTFQDNHLPGKAEEIYKAAAVDAHTDEGLRIEARSRLAETLVERWWGGYFADIKEWVEGIGWVLGVLIGLALIVAGLMAIRGNRKLILIHDFRAPTDELARGVAVQLKYARAAMYNPALSPIGVMPASLTAGLFAFDDEVDPVEDVELAGAKIPFAALSRIFGEPAIQVQGGFDGIAPQGTAYAVISMRGHEEHEMREKSIRVGVPREQKLDIRDFAYDVIVRASAAYADV